MAINVNTPFRRTGPNPIDDSITLTKAEMLAINDDMMPDVYFAICKDDGNLYTYSKTATPSTETGKFKLVEGGGGGSVPAKTYTMDWDEANKELELNDGTVTQSLPLTGLQSELTAGTNITIDPTTNTISATGGSTGVELTQAEYDALPDEEKNNGTIYFIKDGQGGGSGLPTGGTTGQYLVKKSNADGDAEWKDLVLPDGWGVAKSETISVPVIGTSGSFTINISDLGITSVNDYNVVFSIVGGTGSGAWGDSTVFVYGRTTSAINGSVNTVGGDIQSILVSYVVVAKGFGGGVSGSGLPAGGTTGQILAKASNNDGDAYWISNAGSDLVKYERQYGAYAPSAPVTQLVAINAGKATSVSTRYEIPIVGCLTSIVNKATREENKEAFTNAITNVFDVYVEVEDEGSERKLESRASSADSTVRWVMNPQKFVHEHVSYLFEEVQNNKISLLFSYRDDRLITSSGTRATVGSVRLVAKNGNNFGISTGTNPKYVRNLTGMVLDDLEITGSNIPTSWGVAASGTAEVPIVNQVGQFAFSISGLEITNPNDYNVALEVIGGGTGSWGDSNCYLWEKSADRFAGSVKTAGSDVDRVDISYTIFAKGYGNLIGANNAILESPNGTKYKLKVADDGSLSTEVA